MIGQIVSTNGHCRVPTAKAWHLSIDVRRTTYPRGYRSGPHAHAKAQLIYPSRGVLTLHFARGSWIVPPQRACWLPAEELHDVEAPFGLEMHSSYCMGAILTRLPREAGIVPVSALLRAALFSLETAPPQSLRRIANIERVIVDEIELQTPPPLHVPILTSPRLGPIQTALQLDPSDQRTLRDWATKLGIASRTLAREFQADARMTFSQYRSQFRLHRAIELLAEGQSVTAVAYDLGFASPSIFIAMFRKATGATPGTYFTNARPLLE